MASVGGEVVWNLDLDSKAFDSGIKKASSSAKDLGHTLNSIDIKGMASKASSAFGGIADSIAGVAKSLALITVGSGGIGSVFLKSASDLQTTSKSFEVLTGNVAVANKLFSQLADYANNTPFEFPEIARAGKTLLGFGINSGVVLDRVKMLGDIAAATGADFSSLAVVFGQVNATGRLMGQDALQLINNSIPITTILAKKLGTTVQDVKARMEEGAISADLFNEALLETTKQGGFAFKGTDILAQTLNGRLSTLKDTALEFGRNLLGVKVDPQLGLTIKPGGVFDIISQAVPKITKALSELAPKFTSVVETIVKNGRTVVAVIGAVVAAFAAAKLAAIGFAIVAAINPFTLIAAAVVALIAGLTYLQIKFGILTDFYKAHEATINSVGEALSSIGKTIVAILLPPLKELWDVFSTQLLPQFKKLWELLSPILLPVLGAIATILAGEFLAGWWLAINAIKLVIEYISNIIGAFVKVGNGIKDFITDIIHGEFGKLPGDIADILSGIADIITAPFRAAFNTIKDGIKEVKDSLGSIKSGAANTAQRVLDPFKLFHNALGTSNFPGGSTVVGERGPEIVNLPRGSEIIPNHKIGSQGSSAEYNIGTINISSEADGERWLKKLTRNQEIFDNGLTPARNAY